jgi:hypothetical protein
MKKKPKFSDHDAELIDDLRRAFIKTTVSLPNGATFDGSSLAAQAGFEKAAAQIVLERIGATR